uniref:Transmembrane protein n=1 Tax=Leersia perrieri TaxID=77586 RepID=A0A0D9WMB3_9ORYZ
MVKSMKTINQGLGLFCLFVLVCSTIPLQIRGQTTNKIRSNMQMGVNKGISSGDVKVNVCYRVPAGYYCCSKDAKCYGQLEVCLQNCTY